ncbi:hypothetical protein ACFVXQ_03645 [Kitasatospora sp. NPDC058263]
MPAPRGRCRTCAELARQHAEALARFDRSMAVDVRIWMRGHQDRDHEPTRRIVGQDLDADATMGTPAGPAG